MTTITAPGSVDVYAECLGQLPDFSSREDRAAILDTMAQIAAKYADYAMGVVPAGSDDSPLGWLETATLLRCLAAAERGLTLATADDGQADGLARAAWQDLASATTSEEYMAAFDTVATALEHALSEDGRDLADATRDPGRASMLRRLAKAASQSTDPRGIALRRLSVAARACASAYPDHTA